MQEIAAGKFHLGPSLNATDITMATRRKFTSLARAARRGQAALDRRQSLAGTSRPGLSRAKLDELHYLAFFDAVNALPPATVMMMPIPVMMPAIPPHLLEWRVLVGRGSDHQPVCWRSRGRGNTECRGGSEGEHGRAQHGIPPWFSDATETSGRFPGAILFGRY